MEVLTEKNTQLSQELEECKCQLQAALAQQGSPKRPPLVTYPLNDKYRIRMWHICRSDDKIVDDAGVNPDKQQLIRQLKAGKSVLTRVRQEKK